MARKPKETTERKGNVLRIRLTDVERAVLDEAAKQKSFETSTWARSELIGLARKILAQKTK